ncbi:BTAD domain-containing putative transcriptional regulator [Thermomonospora umbrina]|uniref:Putative ATPase n=1 Tax=Thermomonospora umbrina TaxID=111806 RepID=A0A3D9SLS6_9ACTN|nr:BTAD domain-containing putative transcriptional regulator [Thermomonospora umbrina]REE95350.1 putative ATPase [Thermomonospora umbrina]
MSDNVRIGILGPVEVTEDGRQVTVGGARLRALLTRLALDAGRVVPTERLIDDLWEDRPPAGAPNALQSLISRLRATVGRDLVETPAGGYRLAVPVVAVDAHAFEAAVAEARDVPDPAERSARLRDALASWRGPALADVSGLPFAEGPVARLEGLRRAAREDRVDADLALGRHAELIPELQALAAADPMREPLRARLMRALYGAGRPAEALAVYADIRRLLADTLGVDPSPELQALHLAMLRRDPVLLPDPPSPVPATPPVPASDERPRLGNLRARLTSFIGRDDDMHRVVKMLGEARLVTLIGPGGAGKTRLALECGDRLHESMPDGVWSVELAPVTDPAEVPHAVLAALGLRETALISARGGLGAVETTDPLDRLGAALAGKRMLVLLDNCEHLLDAAAGLAARLLADCPQVRVLATSREPMGITGETLWPVEPLPLPPSDASPEEAVAFPSVRLLADRAAAVRPGFTVTAANVGLLVRICRALDGMPLAIELAAARLRALTAGQLAERLDDRFRLLTAGSRSALPRHRTLRAVVEWSWELLEDAERALWRRLAVFAGGATVASAEAVCPGDALAGHDVFEVLSALVDKSLVVLRTETGGAAPVSTEEVPRYLMLETIRAYGLERLAEAGEEERYRRAHAEYFADLAEAADPRLRSGDQVEWLARLSRDHDNLTAALRWAIGAGDAALAIRMCARLGWYWWLRGQAAEGADFTAEVLAMPGLPADQTTAVAAGLAALGSFGSPRDVAEIQRWLLQAEEIRDGLGDEPQHPMMRLFGAMLRGLGPDGTTPRRLDEMAPLRDDPDPWVASMAWFVHGQMALNSGRLDAARHDFGIALTGFRGTGDRWGISFALTAQAEMLSWDGRHAEALALYEEALGEIERLGVVADAVRHAHTRMAGELFMMGRHDEARRLLDEAMRDAERSGSTWAQIWMLFVNADLAVETGGFEQAARDLDRIDRLLVGRHSGPIQFRAMLILTRARLAAASGDRTTARAVNLEGLRLAVESRDNPVLATGLSGLADVERHDGALERAAELLGMGHSVRGMRDRSRPEHVRLEESLRASLGDEAFTVAYERGRARDEDAVLAFLNLERPSPPSA